MQCLQASTVSCPNTSLRTSARQGHPESRVTAPRCNVRESFSGLRLRPAGGCSVRHSHILQRDATDQAILIDRLSYTSARHRRGGGRRVRTRVSAAAGSRFASTVTVTLQRPLGLVLAEEPAPAQNVIVEEVKPGGNAALEGSLKPGDVIVSVGVDSDAMVPCEGIGFDAVMDALQASPDSPSMQVCVGRSGAAGPSEPAAAAPAADVAAAEAVATEVLCKDGTVLELSFPPDTFLRNDLLDAKVGLYDAWGTMMNCNGGGQCGTCMVEVQQGAAQLSPRTDAEDAKLKKRPTTWRLACQTVVEGTDPDRSKLRVKLTPQKK